MVAKRILSVIVMLVGLTSMLLAQAAPIIKAGDTLQLICAEESSINQDYRVTSDGLILVDFLGAVKVSGLTEIQAADKIAKQLLDEKILKKATVSIRIVGPEIKMIKFSGAVKLAAETAWKSGMTLADIIRLAEILPDTNLANVQIKSEDGKIQIADTTKGENPALRAGDEVTFFKKESTTPTTNPDNTKPPVDPKVPVVPGDPTKITLRGKVFLPGVYDLTPNLTLRELLVRAGGFSEGANLRAISLERSGAKRTLTLPTDSEFRLQAGDIIVVDDQPKSTMFVVLDGSVKRPGRYEISEGAKLSELIKLAGGFNEGAQTNRVRIYSTANTRPREVNYEDIVLGYRGDIDLQAGQTIEVPGPRSSTTAAIGPRERAAAGAIAILLLFGS